MTELILGRAPAGLRVILTVGATFVAGIRTKDGSDWPMGTAAELIFDAGPTTWSATVMGSEINWQIASNQVDALIALGPTESSLWEMVDSVAQLWARGGVVIQR